MSHTLIQEINEAAIVAHLKEKVAQTGIKDLRLGITTNDQYGIGPCTASCFEPSYACAFADTFDNAINDLRSQLKTPSQLAAAKRAAAQKLNDEANALEKIA